jgi:hypothetical protein
MCHQSSSPYYDGLSVHPFPHNSPHFELHFLLCRDVDSIQSLRVLRKSCRTFSDFKNTEVAKFQTVVVGKLCRYLIEELLHYRLYDYAFTLCRFSDSIDKILLRYRWHQSLRMKFIVCRMRIS